MQSLAARTHSLSFRIPLMLIACAFLSALAVGVNSHFQASRAIVESDKANADSIARYRAGVLQRLGDGSLVDIRIISEAPTIREAYEFLLGVYEARGTRDDTLHRHYVQRKATGEATRADYLGADDKSTYAIGHRRWHPVLRGVAQEKKYYDLFLITPQGEVIYTVEKEPDFATNLRTGPWKNTGLARAFEGALQNATSSQAQFEDFEHYAPSNGAPAAFLAKAMRNESGHVVGVVAVQFSDQVIADVISSPFGNDGTAYAVGSDGRLRTPVNRRGEHKLFSETPHASLIRNLKPGATIEGQFGSTLDGSPAYIALAATEFMGKKWYLVGDITEKAIKSEVNDLALRNALIGIGVLLVLSIAAVFVARRISRPINAMQDAVGRLARGESGDIPGEARRDELGELARSLRQVHSAGVAAAQIKSALDCASVNVMVADPAGKIVYCNPAMLAFFKTHAGEFHQQFPTFSAEQMIGATIDQFHRAGGMTAGKAGTKAEDNARIKIGGLTIELKVNAIKDASGQSIGLITEWHDISAELSAMAEVTQVVEAAVRGDFSGRIREDNKSGAVRDLAAGQNRINKTVETAMEEFSETLRRVAEGDLIVRVSSEHEGRFAQLANGINDTVSRLSETVATIQRSARDLNRAAGEINAGATDLAKRTEEEASSLEETAATTEELAASVKQTADNSKVANELSEKAKVLAANGGSIVHEAIHAMERIEDASRKITDIISVIDDIAFQTNLLALNAAVEAARAGDAGKGFAVVASEVRTLAQRSGQAARDIKDLIVGSASQVVEGVRLVHATGQSLDSIVSASGEVAQMIAMIHSAASEQAHGIEEMSTAVARIDEMTQQNSALAEESAASASELMKQLERLNSLVATFRIEAGQVRGEAMQAPPRLSASEPDRLRQLAAEAFAQSRVSTPAAQGSPRPQLRTGTGGSRGSNDWTEF